MPSISDLGKPASPEAQPNSLLAEAARDAALKRQNDRIAETAKLLSTSFPTVLGAPKARVHEVTIETPLIVQVLQEQAAQAKAQAEAANRPRWKRWVFWSSLIGGAGVFITFVLTVLTYYKTFGW